MHKLAALADLAALAAQVAGLLAQQDPQDFAHAQE